MNRPAPLDFSAPLDWVNRHGDSLAIGALVALGLVALMLMLRSFGRRMLASDPDCHGWRGLIARVFAKTGFTFMVAAALAIVCSYAPMPEEVARLSEIAFVIAAAFQAAIWGREIILGIISHRVTGDDGGSALGNALSLIRVLVSVALFAIAIVVILDNLGVNVTALVAGLGIGGIAIGLAAQGIFSDLFAALAIVFDRPFRRGDLVRYGTTTGTVERIGLKTTRLRSVTGEQVVMANTKLLEQELHNLAEAKSRRVFLPFALAYGTPPELIEALPEIAAPAIVPHKGCRIVRCGAVRFSANSIDVELVYDDRTNEPDKLAAHKSAIIIALVRIFADHGIDFANPGSPAPAATPAA
ncbi:MAG TPA: mechanosensitive ion channel domain-containing protein [Sphingomicrobium sp.]|nr:mechanosensitive ion channel domain-containing protein [Sphingomicrobium sp.]